MSYSVSSASSLVSSASSLVSSAPHFVNSYLSTGSIVRSATLGSAAYLAESAIGYCGLSFENVTSAWLECAESVHKKVYSILKDISNQSFKTIAKDVLGYVILSSGFIGLGAAAYFASFHASSWMAQGALYSVYEFGVRSWSNMCGKAMRVDSPYLDMSDNSKALILKVARLAGQVGLYSLTGNLILSIGASYAAAAIIYGALFPFDWVKPQTESELKAEAEWEHQ